jgi:hypothetical protein
MAAIPRLVNNEWWMLTIANLSDNDIYGDLPIHLTCDGRSAEIGCSHAPVAQSTGQGARSSPEPLYLRYGFTSTGEILNGEIGARLALSSAASATSLNTARLPTTVN